MPGQSSDPLRYHAKTHRPAAPRAEIRIPACFMEASRCHREATAMSNESNIGTFLRNPGALLGFFV